MYKHRPLFEAKRRGNGRGAGGGGGPARCGFAAQRPRLTRGVSSQADEHGGFPGSIHVGECTTAVVTGCRQRSDQLCKDEHPQKPALARPQKPEKKHSLSPHNPPTAIPSRGRPAFPYLNRRDPLLQVPRKGHRPLGAAPDSLADDTPNPTGAAALRLPRKPGLQPPAVSHAEPRTPPRDLGGGRYVPVP